MFLPGESHGQRSLVGPWGIKESDTTEWLSLSLSYCKKENRKIKVSIVHTLRISDTRDQIDSICLTVMHLRWWWDTQTEGSRWQPILGESGLRERSGLKMQTWDSCRRLWTKCYENVASHLYEIIQLFTSLKHVFPKICPWFPGKIFHKKLAISGN